MLRAYGALVARPLQAVPAMPVVAAACRHCGAQLCGFRATRCNKLQPHGRPVQRPTEVMHQYLNVLAAAQGASKTRTAVWKYL